MSGVAHLADLCSLLFPSPEFPCADYARVLFCSKMYLLMLPYAEQSFSYMSLCFNSSSLEQRSVRDVSPVREAMENISQHIHHSVGGRASRGDCTDPCVAPQEEGAARWVRSALPVASAGSGLVLVSARCKECVGHCLAGAHGSPLPARPAPTQTSPPVHSCLDPVLSAAFPHSAQGKSPKSRAGCCV